MNREQRRELGAQQVPGEHCPDCNADAYTWTDPNCSLVQHFRIEHDDTCPTYRRMTTR